jgi:hypothetical protein
LLLVIVIIFGLMNISGPSVIPYTLVLLTLLMIKMSYLIKLVWNSFQIKLKDRSTATNLLDEELLKDILKKSKKRREEKKEKAQFFWNFQEWLTNYRYTTIK